MAWSPGSLDATVARIYAIVNTWMFRNAGTASSVSLLSASASWTPGAISANTTAEKDITITGVTLASGAFVQAGYNQILVSGLVLCGKVKADDTVTVSIANVTAGSLTPTAGTAYAQVWVPGTASLNA